MEMYSISWGVLIIYIMLGPLVGCLLVIAGIPAAIYSIFTSRYRRALIANRIAVGFSVSAVLLTLETWYEIVTGRLLNGKPVDHSDPDFTLYAFIAALEGCAVVVSVVSSVRQALRRPSS